MKKKILIAIDSLECAGAEKSLVTLLSLLDYSSYSVDLMLFGHGGLLENLVPKEVTILPPSKYSTFSSLNLVKAIKYTLKNGEYKKLFSRLNYSLEIRKKKYSNPQKARLFWQKTSKVIEYGEKEYDIAISYAQGIPTFYVAEKVNAKKKFAWVNVSYRLENRDKQFQRGYYDSYNKIVAVSESTKEIFLETFPHLSEKVEVIYDINNPELINRMADIEDGYNDGFNGLRILTIGRLAYQKGYDIALDAAKMLNEKGINFKWYALGKGPLEQEIRLKIKEYGLVDKFVLLGVKANPYPYIKKANIYVQTSRFEGFGLAIAEARILNTPVVTTKFDAVFNQMIDEKNGLVVDMDSKNVFEGIMRLILDNELNERITKYLECEKKGNKEEIAKFYCLIG
ncbi:glycosyltransferase [Bacillus sp. Y1]|nr:glycosyltransferase [Bacillus sp. Y1]AYA77602.1 glycosyltransferase [Bacillus sp. Y1]